MPGNFIGPDGDLENIFVTEYDMIDRYVTTGSLWLWGLNDAGRQLGDNTSNPNSKSSPIQTSISGTNWKEIAYKQDETLSAIKSDGTLWVWGRNSFGQIGMGSTTVIISPVQTIAGGTNWKQVSSGSTTGAIKTDGTLWMWGRNSYGQLGDNTQTNRSSPVQTVAGGNNWKQVTSGNATGAIKTDGTLWMWGFNYYGALGDNTRTTRTSPIQTIAGGTNWKQVTSGYNTTAAIKTDGTLWTWGLNDRGQLGDNTRTSRSSPIQTIAGGTNWKQVSVSTRNNTAAIKSDGTLWTWGDNDQGQLGDNTITNKSSPVQTVAGGTNWKQVSMGHLNCGAIKTDGTLWMWGTSNNGALGDNTSVKKSSPVQTVAGGNNWKQLSAGQSCMAIYFYDAYNLYPSA